jgi:hypothetical protein
MASIDFKINEKFTIRVGSSKARKMRSKPETIGEHMARLQRDPEYLKRAAARDEELKKREAAYRLAEAPLVADLSQAGFKVNSVWDLVNTSFDYSAAFPVLLRHLSRNYPDAIRDGIARALARKWAFPGWAEILAAYRVEIDANPRSKQGLAAALSAIANESVINEVVDIMLDRRNGESRGLLLVNLLNSPSAAAKDALRQISDDPDLTGVLEQYRKQAERNLRQREKRRAAKAAGEKPAPKPESSFKLPRIKWPR